ncbi:MAG: hypothetical protein SFU86_11100 [Pirellulaceae bacterium]|nr:hypothetical protein [Pirellulaceae bacterium]
MSRLTGESSQKLLYGVLFLLALCMLAPLAWRLRGPLAVRGAPALPAPEPIADREPVVESGIALVREQPELEFPSEPAVPDAGELEPVVAPIRPLVAENIDLDPSITETPALPAFSPPPLPEPSASGRGLPAVPSLPLNPASAPIGESPAPATELPETEVTGSVIQPVPAAPAELAASKAWAYPAGLIEQLNVLSATLPEAGNWARRAKAEAEHLAHIEQLGSSAAGESLDRLAGLAAEARTIARTLPTDQARSQMLRAGYAIVRRLEIWDQVHAAAKRGKLAVAPVLDRVRWEYSLADIENRVRATGAGANWRKYLLLDEARATFDNPAISPADQRQLARDMLSRLHSTQLSVDQSDFLRTPPFLAWEAQLRCRAAETPDLVGLLDAIERYEHDDLSAEAKALARRYDDLRWSAEADIGKLAETVNMYYRNANIRVALSAEMINRLLPKQQAQYEPVQDVILGANVSGDSHTNTRLRLVLLPDRRRWRLGLEANGSVASSTASSKGPATFYQDGQSFFRARKTITVDHRGIRLGSAEAEANANTSLNDFETDFDGIPLLSTLVRAIARNQYDSSQGAAKAEVEGKIIGRASSQLDRDMAERLEKAKRDFQAKLLDPLQKLHLDPTAVELETTTDRLIARYRVAGRDQVSAHTARPQAPGDSILSVQLHESALNNVIDHLGIAGRRIELHDLYREMITRFKLVSGNEITVPEDLPEGVYVTFAEEDPVRIDCEDGRVRLTIRLAELSQGTKHRWQNFTVRGYYAPTADQLDANLAREGVIELIGDKLRFGDQIALRGIFSRVLSRNRKLNLVNNQISKSPELQDQQVTQFVIHDGWIGVALGPKAPGREALVHPRGDQETRIE